MGPILDRALFYNFEQKENMYKNIICLFLGLGLIVSCAEDPSSQWEETNLIEYGVPLKIKAPDSIEVKKSSLAGMEDITIKGDNAYSLQIFASEVNTRDLGVLVSEQRSLVQEENYFRAFEKEWDAGFIYSMQLDSNTITYDFRHIRLQGDKQYIFQAGMMDSHTQEEIERLVSAVRMENKK